MELSIISRAKNAWNAFRNNKDPTAQRTYSWGSYSYRPDRPRLTRGNERSIITAIYNRIALDVAAIDIIHCDLDADGRYIGDRDSKLNNCLKLEANLDQTPRAFRQDVTLSMCDEGVIAIVPTDTTDNPRLTEAYDVLTMRTGKVLRWFPRDVEVQVYNENTGEKQDLILPKKMVCLIENPHYAVMNEPSSTLQRLIRKLNILDAIDEQSGSGKLDMIIQLPYVVKSPMQKERAEERRRDIESQLTGSKYGIAYIDGTERVTQLNRPVENNLMKQIEYLTSMLYSQLGITQGILDGTADEKTMLNYYDRTVEPIVSAIVDEMKRKFLSKTARSGGQSILYFRNPFKLVPVGELAEIADKMTRNEIMTKNEFRPILGLKPSKDPKADMLINSNINQSNNVPKPSGQQGEETEESKEGDKIQNGEV
jgi:hypothetical protein